MAPNVEHQLLVDRFDRGVKDTGKILEALERAPVPTSGGCGASPSLASLHHDALRNLLGGQLLLLDYRLAVLKGAEEERENTTAKRAPDDSSTGGLLGSIRWGTRRVNGLAAVVLVSLLGVVATVYVMRIGEAKSVDRAVSDALRKMIPGLQVPGDIDKGSRDRRGGIHE